MNRKQNVGIVGCGMIADVYIRNIQSVFSDRLHLLGVSSRRRESAWRYAQKYGIARCYDSYEQMLADPEIDIVLNLCPPDAHFAINMQALEAGKHVYCEKPLAARYQQGVQLLSYARAQNRYLCCAPGVPLGALIQTARKLVQDGKIGRVVGASVNLVKPGVETWHPNPDFLYQPGAGPLMDMGPYYLTALLHMAGPFQSVCAMDAISFPTRTITSQPRRGQTIQVRVPTYVNALLQLSSGALATFTATFDVWKSKLPWLEIYGSEGTLSISDPNLFGGTIEIAAPGGEYCSVPLLFPYADNSRGLGLWDMARAITMGTEARTDAAFALHILETMEAIAQSARTGRKIALETQCRMPEAMPLPQS